MKPRARTWLLTAASLWALAWLGISLFFHINEPPGVRSITVGGTTYYGHPPALTIYEQDPITVELAMGIFGCGLAFAWLEAAALSWRKSLHRGVIGTAVGILLIIYSGLGLFWGLLSGGVVGLLVLASASSMWAKREARDPQTAPSGRDVAQTGSQ